MSGPAMPWTDPKVGDVSALDGGAKRVVLQVSHLGDYPNRVAYQQGDGNTLTIGAERWERNARLAMLAGGVYQRGTVEHRYEGGAFVAREMA